MCTCPPAAVIDFGMRRGRSPPGVAEAASSHVGAAIPEVDSLDSPGAADYSHTPEGGQGGLAAARHTLHSPAVVGAWAEGSRTAVAVGSHNYSCCSYSPVAALMDKRVLGHTAPPSRLTPPPSPCCRSRDLLKF